MLKILILILTVSFPWLCQAQKDIPQISMFATSLETVCPKPSDLEGFNATCKDSAESVYPTIIPAPLPPLSTDVKMIVKKQNELVLAELINRGLYNSRVPDHLPKYGFQQLSIVFGIYETACPIVPQSFLQMVFHLFTHLHWKTAVDRTEFLHKKHHKWILRLLSECSKNVLPVRTLTGPCKETIIAKEECSNFICTQPEHEFRLRRSDPISDVIFKAVELVQSVCFPNFRESYRMWHYFHLTTMDTFTDEIKTRWTRQVEDFSFWKRLLGPNFDIHLLNMERCNNVTVMSSKIPYRIPRNSMPARLRLTGIEKMP